MIQIIVPLLIVMATTSAKVIKLSALNIDPHGVTVSGLSAGGFIAVQMHIAYSNLINGSAIYAAGPYFCAEGNLMTASEKCMYAFMSGPNIDQLISYTNTQATKGTIDPVSNLKDDKIYLFSGTKDSVVNPTVVQSLKEYYAEFVNSNNIVTEFDLAAQHCLPTLNYGEQCNVKMSPYIGKCQYDGAGVALKQLYGNSLTRGSAINANLYEFDQTEFFTGTMTSLDQTGFIYIPTACANGATQCKLHMSFHGCEQGQSYIQDQFAANTGFNEWAEANNIVVVYPYVVKDTSLGNGNGCFDWWGYTDANYALQSGVQMKFSKSILDTLMANA
jgi:poly(3-hydroxybutyrate) depolymerase